MNPTRPARFRALKPLAFGVFFHFLLLALPPFLPSASAQAGSRAQTENRVANIEVEGLENIDQNLIFQLLESRPGQSVNSRTVSNDIKNIFELGYFSGVRAEKEKDEDGETVLIFRVVEKPVVGKITFKGNHLISDDKMSEYVKTILFQIYDAQRERNNTELIRKEYVKKGHYNAEVSLEVVTMPNGQLELIYSVRENPQSFLTEINIKVVGEPFFYPIDLKRRLLSSEADCVAWLKSSGLYDEERINQDLIVITQTYFTKGFIRVRIPRPEIKLIHNPSFSRFVVDLEVIEGEQYFVDEIIIDSADGKDLLVDKEELLERVALKKGDVYNPFLAQDSRIALGDIYLSRGYAYSNVRMSEEVDETTKKVTLRFAIFAGEKAYINRINVQGNKSTHDKVIRRELSIYDGELFNGVKLRSSQRNLEGLGYFAPSAGVVFNRSNLPEENKVDYNIKLTPTTTGSINGSLSFSDNFGLGLTGTYSKRNFRGLGQSVSVSVNANVSNNHSGSIRFVEPYLFGEKITSSSSVNYSIRDDTDFDTLTYGFSQGFSKSFWPSWSLSTNYSWSQSTYSEITEDGEETLDGETFASSSSVRLGLIYYSVNNPQFPSDGLDARLFGRDTGGIWGGTQHYNELTFSSQYFHSLSEDKRVVFMANYEFSKLFSKNGFEIPPTRRYRLGGPNSIRGFSFEEIEGATSTSEFRDGFDPNDLNDSSSDLFDPELHRFYTRQRGGDSRSILNLELLFPLTREGFNIRGVVFYDLGNVWQGDNTIYDLTGAVKNYAYMRGSYGIGVRLITGGLGVMRFEYGAKTHVRAGESPSEFHFTISSLF